MKKTIISSIIALILLISYILLIHYYANYLNSSGAYVCWYTNSSGSNITVPCENNSIDQSEGTFVKIGIQEQVSNLVTRPRWYGTIKEDSNMKKLYLFNIIPVTLYAYGTYFSMSYWIVLGILFFIVLMIFIYELLKKQGGQNEIVEYMD